MLVLSRRVKERIFINRNIVITVNEVRNAEGVRPQVVLGIEAPDGVEIHREEILSRILIEEAANGK